MYISKNDAKILKQLAGKVYGYSQEDRNFRNAERWKRHNDLKGDGDILLFADPENGWKEILPELRCTDWFARSLEESLLKDIVYSEEMGDDKVVDNTIFIPHIYSYSGYGIASEKRGAEVAGGAYAWEAPLKDYDMLGKLQQPRFDIDFFESARRLNEVQEVFGGKFEVKYRTQYWWTLGLTSTVIDLRGFENMLTDLYDYPDELKAFMSFLSGSTIAMLDKLEKDGALTSNNGNIYVGSGGFGFTNCLKKADGSAAKLKDMWGFCESQETSTVSPDQFAEFVLPYQLPILEKFGLNCYGCCEPLDLRFKYLRGIPALRRVSVSPWAGAEKMAEQLKGDYIYSFKPNPAMIAVPDINEEGIAAYVRGVIKAVRDHGCHLEIIMKDCNTLAKKPENLYTFNRIVKQEISKNS